MGAPAALLVRPVTLDVAGRNCGNHEGGTVHCEYLRQAMSRAEEVTIRKRIVNYAMCSALRFRASASCTCASREKGHELGLSDGGRPGSRLEAVNPELRRRRRRAIHRGGGQDHRGHDKQTARRTGARDGVRRGCSTTRCPIRGAATVNASAKSPAEHAGDHVADRRSRPANRLPEFGVSTLHRTIGVRGAC